MESNTNISYFVSFACRMDDEPFFGNACMEVNGIIKSQSNLELIEKEIERSEGVTMVTILNWRRFEEE